MLTQIGLKQVKVQDGFWGHEMELVRTRMIPYQWEALNDRVEDAAPSYCMHNVRAAARLQARRRSGKDAGYWKWDGRFETLPEKGTAPSENAFYGFVFQDSDLYKWLEAVSYSLISHPDPELEAQAAEAIRLLGEAQEEDGYLDTFYILQNRKGAFSNLTNHHELYCLGHMTEAAVAWHQATGKDDLIRIAGRFADCVASFIGPEEGKMHGYPGHEIAEMALIRLYQETGEKRFLDQALYFLHERGQAPSYFQMEENLRRAEKGQEPLQETAGFTYYQAHMPVTEQDEAVGHAVRAMYLYSGMADAAALTGDQAMREACERLWKSTVSRKMYVTGGVGGTVIGEAFSVDYDLQNDTAYSETCAAIGLVFFARRMLDLAPRAEYANVMERAFYNTVLAGVSMDGRRFFYVNPLETVPEQIRRDERLKHVKPERQKWFGCACCPPNAARLISSLPDYAFGLKEDVLYIHLYIGAVMDIAFGSSGLKVEVRADLPWSDTVTLRVLEGEGQGTIALRLPDWTETEIACEGKEREDREGYAYVKGFWKTGDEVTIRLPLSVIPLAGNARIQDDAGKTALQYGPFVLCLEECDNGKDLQLLGVDTGRVNEAVVESVQIEQVQVPCIRVPGFERVPGEKLYTRWKAEERLDRTLTFVPYSAWGNRGLGEMRVWVHAR